MATAPGFHAGTRKKARQNGSRHQLDVTILCRTLAGRR
jgi:hypothetical protein